MSISLGMAAGAAGVGSALLTRHANGAQDIEYRYMSADQAHTDTGDLVRSSISLMTKQVPSNPTTPDAIAVTYRTDEQHTVIRSALVRNRRRVHLVPETEATLAYLRHTGEMAQYSTVAIVDVGASGTGVSVVDQIDGTVLHSTRASAVSGDVVDGLVYDHVLATLRPSVRRLVDEGDLRARCRGAKEQLVVDSTSFVDTDHAGGSVEITSSTFDSIIAPVLRDLTSLVRATVSNAPRTPDAIALVGGGARIHGLARTMADSFDARIIAIAEPDTATAKGAALLASTAAITAYPAVGAAETATTSPAAKATGALIGALVVGGLLFGYSVNALTPSEDPNISPASTESTQTTTAEPISSTTESTGTSPQDDPAPEPAESNIIVTTTVIPSLPRTWAPDPLPTTQDFSTTTPPTTTPPTSSTTPETTPPTTSTTPSTTETSPPLPGWPQFEWPDIPTFWPEPPENSPPLPGRNGNGSAGARSQTLDPTSKEPGPGLVPEAQQQNSLPTTSMPATR